MMIVILVIHVLLAIALVGVVLIQKSEGGGLGLGSSGGSSMGGLMTGRSTANLLTRTTAILAGFFMLTSIVLAIMAARQHGTTGSVVDSISSTIPATLPTAPTPGSAPAPASTAPSAPASSAPASPAPANAPAGAAPATGSSNPSSSGSSSSGPSSSGTGDSSSPVPMAK